MCYNDILGHFQMVENNRVQSRWAHQVERIITLNSKEKFLVIYVNIAENQGTLWPCRRPRFNCCFASVFFSAYPVLWSEAPYYTGTKPPGLFWHALVLPSLAYLQWNWLPITGITNCNHEKESIWIINICSSWCIPLCWVKRKDGDF